MTHAGFLYACCGEDRKLVVLACDSKTGSLKAVQEYASTDGYKPGSISFFKNKPLAAIVWSGPGDDDPGRLETITTDLESGRCSHLSQAEMSSRSCYVNWDRSGEYILAAYYYAGAFSMHRCSADGVAGEELIFTHTAANAHSITTDPSNRVCFVPHANQGNRIFGLNFNAARGTLQVDENKTITPPEGTGPRHCCWHGTLPILYVSNEQGLSISAYGFDERTGALTLLQTSSAVTDAQRTAAPDATASDIALSSNSARIAIAIRSVDVVSCFAVGADGMLAENYTQTPVAQTPWAMAWPGAGRYLYVASSAVGCVEILRGDADDMQVVGRVDVGQGLRSLAASPAFGDG